jgi:hypothetical protein
MLMAAPCRNCEGPGNDDFALHNETAKVLFLMIFFLTAR